MLLLCASYLIKTLAGNAEPCNGFMVSRTCCSFCVAIACAITCDNYVHSNAKNGRKGDKRAGGLDARNDVTRTQQHLTFTDAHVG